MPVRTRAQQDLILAERLVSEVARLPEGTRKIYGGLCHSFPVLVRTCGLCQAVAFSADKATAPQGRDEKDRQRAHRLLLRHLGELVAAPGQAPPADVVAVLRGCGALEYMRLTRRVLSAWIYFKRFAVSILEVPDARFAEEGQSDAG